jgi:hypothetical protein
MLGDVGQYELGTCQLRNSSEIVPDWLCAPKEMFPKGYAYHTGAADASITDLETQRIVAIENAKANLVADMQQKTSRTFDQLTSSEGATNAQYSEIKRDINVRNNAELTLPPVSKENQFYDEKGNFHVLIKVDAKELEKKIKQHEDMLMREFNQRIKLLANKSNEQIVQVIQSK